MTKQGIHQYDNKKMDGWRAESKRRGGLQCGTSPIGSPGQPAGPGLQVPAEG